MSNPKITLKCASLGSDELRVELIESERTAPYAFRLHRNGELTGSVYIYDDQARALFAWLGARLHRLT